MIANIFKIKKIRRLKLYLTKIKRERKKRSKKKRGSSNLSFYNLYLTYFWRVMSVYTLGIPFSLASALTTINKSLSTTPSHPSLPSLFIYSPTTSSWNHLHRLMSYPLPRRYNIKMLLISPKQINIHPKTKSLIYHDIDFVFLPSNHSSSPHELSPRCLEGIR